MTKHQFHKIKRYLKTKLPDYYRFRLNDQGEPFEVAVHRREGNYVSIGVDVLFGMVSELMDKKD